MKFRHFPRPLVALLLLASAARGLRAQASLARAAGAADLPGGPSAQGQAGDWVLRNGSVAIVVDDIPHPHGFATSGGNLLDASTVTGGLFDNNDRLSSVFTMFNDQFGRAGVYTAASVVNAGGGAANAVLRVSGYDATNSALLVQTDYSLPPSGRVLTITTTLTNNTGAAITNLPVGDAIQWGLTAHFAPLRPCRVSSATCVPDGTDIGGLTVTAVPFLAGLGGSSSGEGFAALTVPGDEGKLLVPAAAGAASSYGVTNSAGSLSGPSGSTWTDPDYGFLSVAAGASASYSRYFIVGDGSVAAISDAALALAGTATGTLSGTVTETGTGAAISGAQVMIFQTACTGTTAKSYTIGLTNSAGQYSANLPAGTYGVMVGAVGRNSSACSTVTISPPTAQTWNFVLSQQAVVNWTITNGLGGSLPVKLSFRGSGGTADPVFGAASDLNGGYSILSATGSGTNVIPPGTYTVTVSRGLEYETLVQSITAAPGTPVSVTGSLARSVDTTGWMSGDFHLHMKNSPDSGIPLASRAIGAAAEGLEIAVPTDHDYITDLQAAINLQGLQNWVVAKPGDEVTTNDWGHFNGYPLTINSADPNGRNGAISHAQLPAQIFAGLRADPLNPVVQVNHPRAGGLGYFDQTQINPVTGASSDPDFSADFDAVEVFNGKRISQIGSVLNDWYHLLNLGRKVTAMGNTDSHQVFGQEMGYPRNFLRLGYDAPASLTNADLVAAVKNHRVVLTNGPFVTIDTPAGSRVGDQETNLAATVNVHVRVQAPSWLNVDTLTLVVNGAVAQTVPIASTTAAVKYDATLPVSITKDSWIVATVSGSQDLAPVIPWQYGTTAVTPFALTNPIWIDHDGDGLFSPPGNPAASVEPVDNVRTVHACNALPNRGLGDIVTVQGTVTAGSYTMDKRNNVLYFQDASGGTTTYQSGFFKPVVNPGDVIRVSGTLQNFNSLCEMTSVGIDVLSRGGLPPAPQVATLAQINAAGESYEGKLVRVNGITSLTTPWPPTGSAAVSRTIGDGTGTLTLRILPSTDLPGSAQPATPFDLIAEVGQYDPNPGSTQGYQLMARRRADLIESAAPPQLLPGSPGKSFTACAGTIGVQLSKAASATLQYGPTTAYGTTLTDAASTTAHSFNLSGLAAGATYHARITGSGASGSYDTGDFTFTVPIVPLTGNGLRASKPAGGGVKLAWNSAAVDGYHLYGRTTATGAPSLLTTAPATTLAYTDTASPSVFYDLRNYNACGDASQ